MDTDFLIDIVYHRYISKIYIRNNDYVIEIDNTR